MHTLLHWVPQPCSRPLPTHASAWNSWMFTGLWVSLFYGHCFFLLGPGAHKAHKLWKILHKMGIPDHLTSLLRNLYAGQGATVRTGHGTGWYQTGNGVHQDYIISPCLFNFYAEYIMRNARLDEVKVGIKIAGRNISNLTWHHSYGRKGRRTEEPLDESERGEWKGSLKATLRKLKSWHMVPSLHGK